MNANGALAVTVPAVTSEQLDLVRKTVANGASDTELKLYLYDCQRQGVHPLDKLLHFTKRGGKYTPVTSIDLMRTRAADTGEYAGSDVPLYLEDGVWTSAPKQQEQPPAAMVTVWRLVQGQRCKFEAVARWSEYYPGDASGQMWRKMPHTMLAKCAEALALRKGFPRQLAGLYAKEELDQAGDTRPGTAAPPKMIVDTTTGAEVPASERPPAPKGFYYIDAYALNNGWHDLMIRDWDQQGGSMWFSTKLDIGYVAGDAFQRGIPVKITYKAKPNTKGEAYLQTVETWKPAPKEPPGNRELTDPILASEIF